MFPRKIKSQLNTSLLLSLTLVLISIFAANLLVDRVSHSYEDVIDNTLPIMKKTSNLSVLSKEVSTELEGMALKQD